MSRDGGKSGKTGRIVTSDEAELWHELTRSLEKAKGKPRVASHSGSVASVSTASAKSQPPASPGAAPPPQPPKSSQPAPLAQFDRRAVRQVGSGKIAIDARLDLHGLRQRDARTRLRTFLLGAQAKGQKTLLVITGKGGEEGPADHLAGALGGPQRGVLRRSVPQWLEEPEFRAIVLSYTTASARHGGDGALYVQLRKARQV